MVARPPDVEIFQRLHNVRGAGLDSGCRENLAAVDAVSPSCGWLGTTRGYQLRLLRDDESDEEVEHREHRTN